MRRRTPLILLAGAWTTFLALPAPGLAQDGTPRCVAEGAPPPAWYSKPPEPPPSVYQAEARSGGCRDAEDAQAVAAGLAARLLLQARSPSSFFTEVRISRRQQGVGPRSEVEHDHEVLERAFARKVMDRSWVDRQETRWTPDGRAEHFVILRADTAAVREVAAEELAGALPEVGAAFSDRDGFQWVSLEPRREEPRRRVAAPPVRPSPSPGAEAAAPATVFPDWDAPQLRRLVLSAQATPVGPDPTQWPGEAHVGLALASDGTGFYAVLGGRLAVEEDQWLDEGSPGGPITLEGDRTLDAFVLLGVPRQLVPVYAGYRHQWVEAGSGLGSRPANGEALVVGFGYPFFTELRDRRIRNLFLEAVVLPDLQGVAGGGRVTVVGGSRLSVDGVFAGSLDLRGLGTGQELGLQSSAGPFADPMLDRLTLEGGLEIRIVDRLGVFALGRFQRTRLSRLEDPGEDRYGVLFRSLETVGEPRTEAGVRVGVRVGL